MNPVELSYPSEGAREIPKSIRLVKTIMASKMLKPSEQYCFMPRPTMLITISSAKSTVKAMLAMSYVSVSQMGYS